MRTKKKTLRPRKIRKTHLNQPELTEQELLNIVRLIRLKSLKARTLTQIPTPTDILIKKAEQKAYNEKVNMVLKMINENLSDEIISRCSEFTLEDIAKIREEYLKQ